MHQQPTYQVYRWGSNSATVVKSFHSLPDRSWIEKMQSLMDEEQADRGLIVAIEPLPEEFLKQVPEPIRVVTLDDLIDGSKFQINI